MANRHLRLGPIFRSWYGSLPVVHVYKPEHVQVDFKACVRATGASTNCATFR